MNKETHKELLIFLHDVHHDLDNLISKKKLNCPVILSKPGREKNLVKAYFFDVLETSTSLIDWIEKEWEIKC